MQLHRNSMVNRIAPLLALASFSVAGIASAQVRATFTKGTAQYRTLPPAYANPSVDAVPASGRTTIPFWQGKFFYQGVGYNYLMGGTDPAKGSNSTTIPTVIVPLHFVFALGGRTLDPHGIPPGQTQSVLKSTIQSPLFQSTDFTAGGTDLGVTQYIDAFQRGNFWNSVSTASPGYHVLLGQPTILPTQVINVPAGNGFAFSIGGGITIGEVDFGYFTGTVLPQLFANLGPSIQPNALPIFLGYNVFYTEFGGCCIIGFHGANGPSVKQAQTFAVATYNDPGLFSVPIEDIHALSHELGEWMDDPFITNAVPRWNGGQLGNGPCSTILEDGDPVTGIAFDVSMLNGFTYHPEDLVFKSWFAREAPSTAVNGWYTYLNSYNTFSACVR